MAKHSKKILNAENQNTVEVLYQKMGDRWFAFSLIDEEVFVGSITQEEIDAKALEQQSMRGFDGHIVGNS